MKYDKSVYRSLALITQFGINMLVPIFLCTIAGVYLGRKFSVEWIVIPLFLIGALAGFRNIKKKKKKIYEKDAVSAKVPSIYGTQCKNTDQRDNTDHFKGHTSMDRDQSSQMPSSKPRGI